MLIQNIKIDIYIFSSSAPVLQKSYQEGGRRQK